MRPAPGIARALLLAVLVVLAGCATAIPGTDGTTAAPTTADPTTTTPTPTPDHPDADAIQSDAVAAANATESYAFRTRMTVELSGLVTHVNSSGVIDRTAREMRQHVTVRSDSQRVNASAYVVDDVAYFRFGGSWQRTNVSDLPGDVAGVVWNGSGLLGMQERFLTEATISYNGTRTLDGRAVHVVEVDPNPHHLKATMLDSLAGSSGLGTDLLHNVNVTAVNYTQYVAVDSGRVVGADIDLRYNFRGQPIDQRVEVRFAEYGRPVNVTVPEAARDAT